MSLAAATAGATSGKTAKTLSASVLTTLPPCASMIGATIVCRRWIIPRKCVIP